VLKWFDLAVRILPAAPIDVNVTADITASRKKADEQLAYIMDELARYAAGRQAAGKIVEAEPGKPRLQLGTVGPPEST
jgi:hypothetical protein